MIFFRRFRIARLRLKMTRMRGRLGMLMAEQTQELEWDQIIDLSEALAAVQRQIEALEVKS